MTLQNKLTLQFAVERFKRNLQNKPQNAFKLALNYFEDWLFLTEDYKALLKAHNRLLAEHQTLTSQLIKQSSPSPRLPSFLPSRKH